MTVEQMRARLARLQRDYAEVLEPTPPPPRAEPVDLSVLSQAEREACELFLVELQARRGPLDTNARARPLAFLTDEELNECERWALRLESARFANR